MSNTFCSCTVGFPRSKSTTNRFPEFPSPAKSTCSKPCPRRTALIRAPNSVDVDTTAGIASSSRVVVIALSPKLPIGNPKAIFTTFELETYRAVILKIKSDVFRRRGRFAPRPWDPKTKRASFRTPSLLNHPAAYFSSSAFNRFTNAAGSAICAPSASSA